MGGEARPLIVISLLLALVLLVFFGFLALSGDKEDTSKETMNKMDSLGLKKFNDKSVLGNSVLTTIRLDASNEFAIVVGDNLYGNVAKVSSTLSEACGYPSYEGSLTTSVNTDTSGIITKSSDEYIPTGQKYDSHHICDESQNIIGIKFVPRH